jgi:histidine ammonia-lyase
MIYLDGSGLTPEIVSRVSDGEHIELAESGLNRMRSSRKLIEEIIKEGRPVYGVTTGLGAKSGQVLDAEALKKFSYTTIRGRAQATGKSESVRNVRAGLLVRLNTLLLGSSGARAELAIHLRECLNKGLSPVVGQIGSIGASDLVVNASIGLSLIGEGRMRIHSVEGPSDQVMYEHGITPIALEPRDGLALCSHGCATSGAAALAFIDAKRSFHSAQTAAALSIEGFRANLSPLDQRVLDAKNLQGQEHATADLIRRLDGSSLFDQKNSRQLQDPLSFRNIAQIHGAVSLAFRTAKDVIEIEINGSSDNPMTFAESGDILSTGAYFTSELALVCEMINRSFIPFVMAQLARISKLLSPQFSGLTMFLAPPDSNSNGFAPLMKTAEALVAEVVHAAQPTNVWPSLNADGVEDCFTTAPIAVRALSRIVENARLLCAIEMIVAAQAIEQQNCEESLGPFVKTMFAKVRGYSKSLTSDRSLSHDLDQLSNAISEGEFE